MPPKACPGTIPRLPPRDAGAGIHQLSEAPARDPPPVPCGRQLRCCRQAGRMRQYAVLPPSCDRGLPPPKRSPSAAARCPSVRVSIKHTFAGGADARLVQTPRKGPAASGIDGHMAEKIRQYGLLIHDKIRQAIDVPSWLVATITRAAHGSASVHEAISHALERPRHMRYEYCRPRRMTLPAGYQPYAAALQKGLRSELWMPRRVPGTACPLACTCMPHLRLQRAPCLPHAYNVQLRLPPRLRRLGPADRRAQRLCCRVDAAAVRRDRAGPDGQTNCAAQACRTGIGACGRHRLACPAAWRKPGRPSHYA